MEARDLIDALRRGEAAAPDALRAFALGLGRGVVSDAQAGAFAMAVCLRGLGPAGRVALTEGMRDSGGVLGWDLPGPVVDKHSSGGIGDCVSLLLAPVLAECGAYVPMISGRGLGHTGGTLDKLEAIPGLSVQADADRLRLLVAAQGCAIVAASEGLAPADRRLYAIRDVTGTVESLDLITASILSKKLAAGLGGLVLDVKQGSGAFMRSPEEAQALAEALVDTARGAGCPAVALITDMDQPLAPAAGNALEVAVVMEAFEAPARHPRLVELTCLLVGEALALAGLSPDPAAGAARARAVLASGAAADRFDRMVAGQGGPRDFVACWRDHLPTAPVVRDVPAPAAGHVAAIDGTALGRVVVALGGGRRVEGDRIDPAVGLSALAPLGAAVGRGDPLARVHAADPAAAEAAVAAVAAAYRIGAAPPPSALVRDRLA
ncbi:MAG: thymidine phosphorylase [Alkalilacustris sp.]